VPKNPVEAAKMRLVIEAFNSKLGAYWPMVLSRGQDDAKTDTFAKEALPFFEELCASAKG